VRSWIFRHDAEFRVGIIGSERMQDLEDTAAIEGQ
jgi:hypothetical protein